MNKILSVFGTRPEAIKMCPVVRELRKRAGVQVLVCLSGQHRQMLDSVMERFGIEAELRTYDTSAPFPEKLFRSAILTAILAIVIAVIFRRNKCKEIFIVLKIQFKNSKPKET